MQSRWRILLMEAQLDPYGVCGGLNGTGVDLSQYIGFLLSFYFPTGAPCLYNVAAMVGPFMLPQMWFAYCVS